MSEESISVLIRIRPLSQQELLNGNQSVWEIPSSNTIVSKSSPHSFTYDRIFSANHSTTSIFEEFGEKIVWGVMEGYNGCIFCYGQTGSGKTFTMHGSKPDMPGIVPLTINTVFAYVHETTHKEFLVRCSYLEIYNECVNDLLDPNNSNLALREDKKNGLQILGLSEKECSSMNQVFSLLSLGDANRQVASTNFNLKSSRSHSMYFLIRFRIVVESKTRDSEKTVLSKGVLNLIDLAGSEGASAHALGAEGQRTQEMKFINRVFVT